MVESEVHLLDYLKVIYKRKWLILAVMIMALTLAAYRLYRETPVYQAICTIRVGDPTNTIIRSGEVIQYTDSWSSEKRMNTHIHIMLSDPVLKDVINALNLGLSSNSPVQPAGLKGYFSIKEVEETNLIRIQAIHPLPEMAQRLANTMATAYRDFNIQKHSKSSKNNVLWLTEEIKKLRGKMEEADHNLYRYKQESHILSLEKETQMQAEELSQLRSTYNQTRVKRIEIDAQIKELDRILRSKRKYVPSFLEGDVLPTLNNRLVTANLELAQLQKKYGPKHPKIIAVRSAITTTHAQIDQNIQKEIKSLQSDHAVLEAKERALDESLETYTQKAMKTEQKQVQYAVLDKETQLNNELYNVLVAKLKEINITEGLEAPEVTIIETAKIPNTPMSSRRNKNLVMSAIIGFVFSLGLAFFLEYLDVGLATREEAEKYLELPVLGLIPQTQTRG